MKHPIFEKMYRLKHVLRVYVELINSSAKNALQKVQKVQKVLNAIIFMLKLQQLLAKISWNVANEHRLGQLKNIKCRQLLGAKVFTCDRATYLFNFINSQIVKIGKINCSLGRRNDRIRGGGFKEHIYWYSVYAIFDGTVKVFMQRNFTSTFYGFSVKITSNGLVTSFTEVHYFASFLRNFALNNMQISYLWHHSA